MECWIYCGGGIEVGDDEFVVVWVLLELGDVDCVEKIDIGGDLLEEFGEGLVEFLGVEWGDGDEVGESGDDFVGVVFFGE